jgi:hypothetical protein
VLLAKKETVVQSVTDGLNEFERCYGMDAEDTKVTAVSRQPSTVQIRLDKSDRECVIFQIFRYHFNR